MNKISSYSGHFPKRNIGFAITKDEFNSLKTGDRLVANKDIVSDAGYKENQKGAMFVVSEIEYWEPKDKMGDEDVVRSLDLTRLDRPYYNCSGIYYPHEYFLDALAKLPPTEESIALIRKPEIKNFRNHRLEVWARFHPEKTKD